MIFKKPESKTELEKIFLDQVEKDTPEKVKKTPLLDLNNKKPFSFTLKKEHLDKFSNESEALGIDSWFLTYKEEAKVSTAGIRGLQNPLYPWDTRYPLNLVGMMLATMGKVLVAKDTDTRKVKIATSEVRYNSSSFVELISRLQAAYDIKTYVTEDYETIPIFLISFIIFMYDLYGGEYVTSSHAMCRKIATKDLNTQGSQYIPSESLKFVDKVTEILVEVRTKGQYKINFSGADDKNIDTTFLKSIKNGVVPYVEYLKQGVATKTNLDYINANKNKIVVECMGGSIYKTLKPILENLGVIDRFDFLHTKEDPFNHSVGKVINEEGKFYDWGCDTTIMKANLQTMDIKIPVVESIDYKNLLKAYSVGTVLLITDPDADRLVTAYIEDEVKLKDIKGMGLVYTKLTEGRILVMFTPNQSFLMTVSFQQKALKDAGLWDKYNWFMLKTTASQRSWDEWAKSNNVPVVNTPVGFKELADSMINIEKKVSSTKSDDITIKDVFGDTINLGKNPRMLFAGEESGGEIFGPPEFISSKAGRKAISMREKSAGEAIIITAAMASWLSTTGKNLTDYMKQIYEENKIISKYEIRIDQKFYNESEPDIEKLLKAKEQGMIQKAKNNSFFLSLALAKRDGLLDISQVKEVLTECFPDLSFKDLEDIKFVGDGTYFLFSEKCVEVRPSGTDAINKAYSYGQDQWECIKYAQKFSGYSGDRTPLHKKYIEEDFYKKAEDYSFEIYTYYKEHQ